MKLTDLQKYKLSSAKEMIKTVAIELKSCQRLRGQKLRVLKDLDLAVLFLEVADRRATEAHKAYLPPAKGGRRYQSWTCSRTDSVATPQGNSNETAEIHR